MCWPTEPLGTWRTGKSPQVGISAITAITHPVSALITCGLETRRRTQPIESRKGAVIEPKIALAAKTTTKQTSPKTTFAPSGRLVRRERP